MCECAKCNEPSDLHKTIEVDTFVLALIAVVLAQSEQKNERLEVENAKLRELCSDMHVWMDRALYEGSTRKYEYESITDRMRELGAEV